MPAVFSGALEDFVVEDRLADHGNLSGLSMIHGSLIIRGASGATRSQRHEESAVRQNSTEGEGESQTNQSSIIHGSWIVDNSKTPPHYRKRTVLPVVIVDGDAHMAKGDDIEARLVGFAVGVLALCERLPKTPEGTHMANQLLRSGTAGAPN